jgi:hypothetical protein
VATNTVKTKLRSVRFNQEFYYQGELWHLLMKDVRSEGGVRLVNIKNRHGVTVWIDWETEVDAIVFEENRSSGIEN